MFLALIGTTLSCMNTGARVTYAMGKDQEVPEHFGMLHEKNLSPHRAIWVLAIISAVIGVIGLTMAFGDAGSANRRRDSGPAARPFVQLRIHNSRQDGSAAQFPAYGNSGIQLRHVPSLWLELHNLLWSLHNHPNFKVVRHFLIPVFGLVANLDAWRST